MPSHRTHHLPGDITTLELLYEGSDYGQWKTKIEMLLRLQGYRGSLKGFGQSTRLSEVPEACAILRAHVSPSIWARCPEVGPTVQLHCNSNVVSRSFNFDKHLKALAQPFRLLDLPAEIRNLIYTITFRERFGSGIEAGTGSANPSLTRPLPPLVHASSQIRNEALPLFYGNTQFVFWRLLHQNGPKEVARARQCFIQWIQEIVKDNAKHISEICIQTTFGVSRRQVWRISLTQSRKSGLIISISSRSSDNATKQGQQEKHVADVNEICEVTGLVDQSLVIALGSSTLSWESG